MQGWIVKMLRLCRNGKTDLFWSGDDMFGRWGEGNMLLKEWKPYMDFLLKDRNKRMTYGFED